METKHKFAGTGRRLTVLFCLGLASALWSAPPAQNALKPAPTFKSEFTDDPKFGKDPFFPNSQRRQATNDPSLTEPPVVHTRLKLQGISGTPEKRMCIVNNRTFEMGEEAEMKLDGKPVKVRCVEIKDRSVIMTLNNLQQELTLGSKF